MAEKNPKRKISVEIDEEELICNVCWEVPQSSPIFQCPEGHIFCNGCQPKLSKCPVCQKGKITNINLIAQKILGTQSHSAPAQRSPTRNNEGSNNLMPNQPFEGDEFGFGELAYICYIIAIFVILIFLVLFLSSLIIALYYIHN